MRHSQTNVWCRWGVFALAVTTIPNLLGEAFVKNPSFENSIAEAWPFYGPVDDWQGGSGVNEAGGPFHNNGTAVPDGRRIGFKQGNGTIAQEITGLTPGKRYWIQFKYDARQGSDLDLAVKFSTTAQGGALDETLDTIFKPSPAIATSSPYYSRTVPFTPDAEGGVLTFEVTSRGDSTALLDGVTIVQRDEGNFAVMNPSFEASGVVYNGAPSAGTDWPAISGWSKTGVAGVDDGTGGQADNGAIPEQALVAFVTDQSSLAQTLAPLVAADNYELSFAYNAKSGTPAHLQVLVDCVVAWEKDVAAVGGTKPFARQSLSFKAAGPSAQITFSNTVPGATVLLDDVKVLGKTGASLPPMVMEPYKVAMRVGDEATASLTLPAERLAQGTAVIKLRSANRDVFELVGADTNGVVSLTFQGNNRTQPYKMRGVGVGNAAMEITEAAGVPFPIDITAVYVAASSFVLNPSFELDKDSGVGTATISGWTTSGANIGIATKGNPFLSTEDLTIPDRRAVLRIQGGGGKVSQNISGLQPGQAYGLQFFYNGRSTGYPYKLSLKVSFAGQELLSLADIAPAATSGGTEYYFQEVRFTPTTASGVLEFQTVVTEGDASLFLDAVSIIPRLANEVAVRNSSFEGSSMGANWPGYLQPELVAGWEAAGGGYGVNAYSPKTFFVEPFLDNGINSDQDNAFFGQGAVSAKQVVHGLVNGQSYTLVFDYNFRDGRGRNSTAASNTGQIEVMIDGASAFASDDVPPVDSITPYPGFRHTLPFYQAFVPFTATSEAAEIQISHTGINGDETYLLDNVRVLPGSRTAPSITQGITDQNVAAGGSATLSVTAPGTGRTYRWYQEGVLLRDGPGIAGSTTASLALTQLTESRGGTYSVLVSDGVGVVGSTALLTVEASPVQDVSLTATRAAGKVIVRWPATATGYRVQRAASLPVNAADWTDESTAPVQNGANWEVSVDPAGGQRYYRLIK